MSMAIRPYKCKTCNDLLGHGCQLWGGKFDLEMVPGEGGIWKGEVSAGYNVIDYTFQSNFFLKGN